MEKGKRGDQELKMGRREKNDTADEWREGSAEWAGAFNWLAVLFKILLLKMHSTNAALLQKYSCLLSFFVSTFWHVTTADFTVYFVGVFYAMDQHKPVQNHKEEQKSDTAFKMPYK